MTEQTDFQQSIRNPDKYKLLRAHFYQFHCNLCFLSSWALTNISLVHLS